MTDFWLRWEWKISSHSSISSECLLKCSMNFFVSAREVMTTMWVSSLIESVASTWRGEWGWRDDTRSSWYKSKFVSLQPSPSVLDPLLPSPLPWWHEYFSYVVPFLVPGEWIKNILIYRTSYRDVAAVLWTQYSICSYSESWLTRTWRGRSGTFSDTARATFCTHW